uniref:Rpn family recombination-promoting nuclease/putative transposase n=1 Tax=Desertifilum tharense IPPAS B-1220 TaxID=1781255 RepID=A0ACD5H188_9CYAN
MIDHDRLFKELLSTFFREFIELFLPNVARYIEADSITFLNQEVFTDITSGERRTVDLLAQVRFRGEDTCFLIHVENQAASQAGFARRMFHYFARLDEKYALPIYPVVIFSFETPQRQESDRYQVEFPDRRVLDFSFVAIQLNRLNWRDFLSASNPIAAALMVKMKIQPEDRPKVKAECLRLLATLRLDPARMQLISGFVDTYLKLNPSEEVLFKAELDAMDLSEEEQVMEIVTSWMERGIEQGLQQGFQQGLQQALQRESALILRLIKTRFSNLSPTLEERISRLSIAEIELLGESLFDFATEAEVSTWLEQREQRQEVEAGVLERLVQSFERVSLDVEKQIRSLPPERLTEFATLEFSTEEAMVSWLN